MYNYLIYTSKAIGDWPESHLHDLLKISQSNNKKNGITGMLVFINNRFLQFIEGEKQQVDSLFAKILVDPRHERVVQLLEGWNQKRLFEGWNMGFKRINQIELKQLTGFYELDAFFDHKTITDLSHPALIFLKIFYEKNYRDFHNMTV